MALARKEVKAANLTFLSARTPVPGIHLIMK